VSGCSALLPINLVFGQSLEDFNMCLHVKFGDTMSNTFGIDDEVPSQDGGGHSDDSVRVNGLIVAFLPKNAWILVCVRSNLIQRFLVLFICDICLLFLISSVRTNEMLGMLKTELQTWRLITSLFIDRVDTERFADENEDRMILDESVCCLKYFFCGAV
jgi:hypothetical protein